MKGWEVRKLGEVCRLINGRAYNKDELLVSGPTPVLRVGNFFTNRNWYYSDLALEEDKYCDEGDLLYAWSASFGPRIWEGPKVIYHYHIWKLAPNPSKIDKQFLFHFLEWDKDRIKLEQGAGTTMIHVTKGSMEARKMPLPPLDEQRRIVAVLDEAFAGLAVMRAKTQANLKNARALFESHLNAIFSQKGEGWVETTLGEVCTTQYGISGSMNTDGKGYKIFRMGEVQRGRLIDTGKMKRIDLPKGEFEPYRLKKGDVLFNRTNSIDLVGKTGIFDSDGDYCFASYLIRVNFDLARIDTRFACHIMNSTPFLHRIRQKAAKSVNQANINATILRNEPIPLHVDVRVQKKLADQLDELVAESTRLESLYRQKLAAIDELKQSLLQKAFAGELTSAGIAA